MQMWPPETGQSRRAAGGSRNVSGAESDINVSPVLIIILTADNGYNGPGVIPLQNIIL